MPSYNQTRLGSFIESIVNVLIGFFISLLAFTWIISPLWGFNTSAIDNLGITLFFTVISVLRSYLIRRFFETQIKNLIGIILKTQ